MPQFQADPSVIVDSNHQDNISMRCIPPYTPVLCSENGVNRSIHIFLFLVQNIDCGYSLEPPHRGGSKVYPHSMFCANIRKKKFY